jgi:hypothetical protein
MDHDKRLSGGLSSAPFCSGATVFETLRRRLLCAIGKHELVHCEDIPIVGLHSYRCIHCGFLQRAAKNEKRGRVFRGIVLAMLAAAVFAVVLLLVSQFVGS